MENYKEHIWKMIYVVNFEVIFLPLGAVSLVWHTGIEFRWYVFKMFRAKCFH
jgi:hypothetical protein